MTTAQPLDLGLGSLINEVLVPLRELELDGFDFPLHSWRPGAATEDFLSHGRLEKTMLRGRWHSPKVARDYLCRRHRSSDGGEHEQAHLQGA